MPIHIPMYINGQHITDVFIGRMETLKGVDAVHEYRAVEHKGSTQYEINFEEGTPFTHRYGDGLLTCVAKGLIAIETEGART